MSLVLKKGNITSTTLYTTNDGDFSYSISVQKEGTTVKRIDGSITKGSNQIGNFGKYANNQLSLNFNSVLTTTEQQAIISDINDIVGQLMS